MCHRPIKEIESRKAAGQTLDVISTAPQRRGGLFSKQGRVKRVPGEQGTPGTERQGEANANQCTNRVKRLLSNMRPPPTAEANHPKSDRCDTHDKYLREREAVNTASYSSVGRKSPHPLRVSPSVIGLPLPQARS
ncbi:hypothetical protein AVEN_182176-1 [Araneus ventricosus]|uniref:Uncharacterized protein n=1 Tax=Araneus ventricosus TaxID=182803 RepID=A0A4Y2GMG4_ARAVE|nr:hypothetical protein AVEN_182176-1 [Araneus ventricosus]